MPGFRALQLDNTSKFHCIFNCHLIKQRSAAVYLRYSGSRPSLVMYSSGNILSIKYPVTVITSIAVRNATTLLYF